MPTKPKSVTIRSYQVGFGDCFLVIFNYPQDKKKYMLVDFGSTAGPKKEKFENKDKKDLMLTVAEHIRDTCGGKLDAVVGSHRHKDHISGFAPRGKKNAEGKTRGDIIRECMPDLVILPWTENPDLATDADEPFKLTSKTRFKKEAKKSFVSNLESMHEVARAVFSESKLLSDRRFIKPISDVAAAQLSFIGQNNISNKKAVENLIAMADNGKGHYVHAEYELDGDFKKDFEKVFPGVTAHILGPPTIKQYTKVKSQRSKDKDEFWLQQVLNKNFWAVQAETAKTIKQEKGSHEMVRDNPFPNAPKYKSDKIPSYTRWFIRRVRKLRGNQLLSIVRILDKALNNTSVILLFEAGDKKLLFPGDAQIENWEYALSKSKFRELLKDTNLYKVGHHGSRNATPKSLWELFGKKNTDKKDKERLKTVISTMSGKHGNSKETAVPRSTLVTELKDKSDYTTTESIRSSDVLFTDVEIEI